MSPSEADLLDVNLSKLKAVSQEAEEVAQWDDTETHKYRKTFCAVAC